MLLLLLIRTYPCSVSIAILLHSGRPSRVRRMNKCQDEESERHRAVQHQTDKIASGRERLSEASIVRDQRLMRGRRKRMMKCFCSSLVFDYLWLTSSTTLNSITLFPSFFFSTIDCKGSQWLLTGFSQRIGRVSIGFRVLRITIQWTDTISGPGGEIMSLGQTG